MSILGNRIKKERENLDLTRENFAKKIGVSYSAIAMYEQGNREPNNTILLKMCEIFDCTSDYLMGKSDYKNQRDYINKNKESTFEASHLCRDLVIKYPFFNISNILTCMLSLYNQNLDVLNYLDKELLQLPVESRADAKQALLFLYNVAINTPNNSISSSELLFDEKDTTTTPQYYMCPVYGQISAGQPNWAEECIEGRLPLDPDLMGIVNPEEHFFLRVNGESMNKIIKNGAFALIHKQDDVENGEIAVVLVNGYDATLKKFSKQEDIIVLTPESTEDSFKQQIYTKETPIKIIGKYVGKMEFNN